MKIKVRIRSAPPPWKTTLGFTCQRLIFGLFWVRLTDRIFDTPQEVRDFVKLLETAGVKVEWKQTYGFI